MNALDMFCHVDYIKGTFLLGSSSLYKLEKERELYLMSHQVKNPSSAQHVYGTNVGNE